MITNWIPLDIQTKMITTLPPNYNNNLDMRYCMDNSMGRFSIADMYHAVCKFSRVEEDNAWSKIWKLKDPKTVRAFVWLIKHGRLLTNVRKNRMRLD